MNDLPSNVDDVSRSVGRRVGDPWGAANTRFAVLLLILYLVVYVAPLGARPLFLPDETRYAEIPREILATGDWIVPRLCGLRYFEKPVLGYWITAISVGLLGENAFAVRLPSALAVGCSGLLIFLLSRTHGGGTVAGLLATSTYLSFAEVFGVGGINVLDSIFCLFITAALTALFLALEDERPARRRLLLILSGAACGSAFLTKGFLGFALPIIVAVPYLAQTGTRRNLLFTAAWLILSGLAIVLPWSIAIYMREGTFWQHFFWVEHIQRFFGAGRSQHPRFFWFYVPIILGGALPSILLAPVALRGLRAGTTRSPLLRFSVCWLVVPFLLFSLSSGKLATYVLPCFPPLGILLGVGLSGLASGGMRRGFDRAAASVGAAALLSVIALVLLQTTGLPNVRFHGESHLYREDEAWKWPLLAAALGWCAVAMGLAIRRGAPLKRLGLFLSAPVLLYFSFQFVVPERVFSSKAPMEFLRRNSHRIHPGTFLVSDCYLAPSVSLAYHRSDVYILERRGELEDGLNYEDSAFRFLEWSDFVELARSATDDNNVVLVLRQRAYDDFRERELFPSEIAASTGFVLVEFPGWGKNPGEVSSRVHE